MTDPIRSANARKAKTPWRRNTWSVNLTCTQCGKYFQLAKGKFALHCSVACAEKCKHA